MNAPLTFKPFGESDAARRTGLSLLLPAIFVSLCMHLMPVRAQQASTGSTEATSPASAGGGTTATPAASGSGTPASGSPGCGNTDSSGAPTCGQEAGNPINVTNGNKYQREVDMPALPGVLGLELVRHYNSSQSRLSDAPGLFGRGWRLSYDWNLRFTPASGNETLVLVKGDGTEVGLIKRRSAKGWDGTWWPAGRPDGRLEEVRLNTRTEYVWTTLRGQRYRFSDRGWLLSVEARGGEMLSIERESKGDITRVTDPQGRELRFELLSDAQALRDKRFGGAQSVTTPLGRYDYRYGGEAPAGSVVPSQRLLSRLLSVEHAGVLRSYLYEDAERPSLLTGIQVSGKGSDGVAMKVRIATWAYDKWGRAFKSVRGEERAALEPSQETHQASNESASPAAPETVNLQFLPPGKDERGRETGVTLLSNSLGQKTVYRFVKIQGRAELLEVLGAGCASCGETNVRNVYDNKGMLLEVIKLAPVSIGKSVDVPQALRTKAGEALEGLVLSYDDVGRLVRRERRLYVAGKALTPATAAPFEVRMEYGQEPFPLNWQAALIARPSVIEGREYITRIRYNAYGQTLSVEESGYSPLGGASIARKIGYRYQEINGRSVLSEVDGPLPNGARGTPEDSDITRLTWDAKASWVTNVIEPGGISSLIGTDAAGRVTRRDINDGFRKVATELHYLQDGRHPYHLERKMLIGEMLSGSASDAPSFARIQPFEAWYDALGRMTRQVDAAGREVKRQYDTSNRLAVIADAQGNRSENVFDGEGHLLRNGLYRAGQTGLLRASYFWHDEQGRMNARLLPDGRLDTWTFDGRGELSSQTDGDEVRSSFMRSKDGLIRASVRQAGDGEMDWSIGPAERRPRGVDDFGRRVEVILPDHGNKRATYDEAGRIVEVWRADKSRIEFRHDMRGRPLRTRYVDSDGKVQSEAQNQYEGLAQVALDDNELHTRYLVDALGRRLEQVVTIKAIGKAYRFGPQLDQSTGLPVAHTLADGRLLEVQRLTAREGGTVSALRLRPSWVHRMRSTMSGVVPASWLSWADNKLPSQTVISNIEVDPLNGLSAFTMGNGLKTQRQFDIAGRLIQQTAEGVGTFKYGYKVGPRIREIITEPASAGPSALRPQTVRYDYTGFGQLKSPGAAEVLQTSLRSQEPLKAITASAPKAIPRDALGRTTEDDRYRFSYTIAGQLSEVHAKSDNRLIARYRYDSQSRRVSKTVFAKDGKSAPSVLYFLWQDQTLVGEIDASGEVATQYLYFDEGSIAKPIAKLGPDATHYIHTDHRGAPVSMTNAARDGVWRDLRLMRGVAHQVAHSLDADIVRSEKGVELNLRLPGQYLDFETQLHDNLNRSYDPDGGHYLQPDPLGYPDGRSAYIYASGDPINKADPLGLYDIEVHYYLMYFLGRVSGLSVERASQIALAAQYVDNNPLTIPEPKANLSARNFYHFVMEGQDATTDPETRYLNPSSDQLKFLLRPSKFKFLTQCQQDQFFGEYLHTFADTFSHRDEHNVPYGPEIGHASANHDADETYNVRDFQRNEARTLEMEREVFNAFGSQFGQFAVDTGGKRIDFQSLLPTLVTFNLTGKVAANAAPKWQDQCFLGLKKCDPALHQARREAEIKGKVMVLNDKLSQLGLGTIPVYSLELAARNRQTFLGGLKHGARPEFDGGDPFMGILLPIDECVARSFGIKC